MENNSNRIARNAVRRIRKAIKAEGITVPTEEIEFFLHRCQREMTTYSNRQKEAMKHWKETPENIQKIIDMNDGLFERFHMAYDDLRAMKNKVERDIASGEIKVSGYTVSVEFFFGYNRKEPIPTADNWTLACLSDCTEYMLPSISFDETETMPSFEDWANEYLIDDLNWNIENLDIPGLEKHHIYMFMHHIFCDADTYCLADMLYLTPEDFQWQICVDYEKFYQLKK